MTNVQLERFRNLLAELDAQHQELSRGGKKEPDAPLSSIKLVAVNSLLAEAASILGDDAPRHCPTCFDVEDRPVLSDVTFVLAHYVHCGEAKRRTLIDFDSHGDGRWRWTFDDSLTHPPKAPGPSA